MKRMMCVVAVSAALAACATGQRSGESNNAKMQVSQSQPAAEGQVKFGVTKNDNTEVNLNVKHLAQPDKLEPSESAYVVWAQRTPEDAPQNIGALKVDKNLDGSLNTETALHRFDLFITAEPNTQVQQPTGDKQLWTSFNR